MRPILLCAIACGLTAAQEPLSVRMLPPDSVAIAGVNVAALRSSVLGKQFIARLKTRDSTFTPDVDEVLVGLQPGASGPRFLMLLRTACDDTKLHSFARAGKPAAERTWRGFRIMTVEPMSFACMSGTLVAGGDLESVKAALTRPPGGAGPDAALAGQAAALRAANDFWFVTGSRFAELVPAVPNAQAAALLKSGALNAIRGLTVGGKLTDAVNVSMRLLAATSQDAESMAGGFVMVAGMLKSDKKRAAQFATLIDAFKVRAEGDAVLIDLTLSQAQLTALASQLESAFTAQAPKPKPEPERKAPSGEIVIHSSPSDMGTVTLPPPK